MREMTGEQRCLIHSANRSLEWWDAVGGNVLGRVKAGAMGLAEFLGKDERIICNGQLSWVCVEVVING